MCTTVQTKPRGDGVKKVYVIYLQSYDAALAYIYHRKRLAAVNL